MFCPPHSQERAPTECEKSAEGHLYIHRVPTGKEILSLEFWKRALASLNPCLILPVTVSRKHDILCDHF